MLSSLELNQIEEPSKNIKTADDIMAALYLTHSGSFLELEEHIKLPYWKRFSYFYSLNMLLSVSLCLPSTHTSVIALAMTMPAVGALILALDKKSSKYIFSLFAFMNSNFKLKTKLTRDITAFKEEIANPILSIKRNQFILLTYFEQFYQEHKYCLSKEMETEIDNLKIFFEKEQYDNALDSIYNLYKKTKYVNNFKQDLSY